MESSISPSSESSSDEFDPASGAAAALAAPSGLRYIARQPILNLRGQVQGYELLFRSGPNSVAFSGDGDSATRNVLDNSVIFGLERLTGGLPMFVNCTEESLLDGLVLVLPPEHTVLELLETLKPTADLIAACKSLKAQGYRLALDDYASTRDWEPLLALADYVKVDLSATTAQEREALVAKLRGRSTKLVLERVETVADLELGRREGFTLFQGYYFCRPVLMQNRVIPANRMIHLEMLTALHDEPLDVRHVSALVKRDASLTYRLLRMVNSPMYATRSVISSIQGAVVLIGDTMFRRIAILAIASEMGGKFPTELVQMAFLRARFCELAAGLLNQDPTEQYLLGIVSLLPAIMELPMEGIASAMPLRQEIREALLGEGNPSRTVLTWLEFYERGDWESCDQIADRAGFSAAAMAQNYAQALLWAEANMSLASGERR